MEECEAYGLKFKDEVLVLRETEENEQAYIDDLDFLISKINIRFNLKNTKIVKNIIQLGNNLTFESKLKNIESYDTKFNEASQMYRHIIRIDPIQSFRILLQKIIPLYKY